jgi:hypothetical protein
MKSAPDKGLLMNQVQTDVSLLSFLSVISIFFLGSLLPKFGSYDISVKIPISFLILATFAFLFSGLILSNASQKIIDGDFREVRRYLDIGYAISEYMGVFLFILSVPLSISIITADVYLRIVTFCGALLGMSVYSFMGFSMLESHFAKSHRLLSSLSLAFGVVLFLAQIFSFYFTEIAVVFLLFIVTVTILAPMQNFQ